VARATGVDVVTAVTLRPIGPPDHGWLSAWLPDAAVRAGHHDAPALLATVRKRGASASIINIDGAPAGIIAWRRAARSSTAAIEFLGVEQQHARRGAGMTAARLLEEALTRRGVRTMYAPAPAAHGIAMYFWIRLGYRPLLRGEWPCERSGVAWLRRDVATAPAAAGAASAFPTG
jgi:hypothetical protein